MWYVCVLEVLAANMVFADATLQFFRPTRPPVLILAVEAGDEDYMRAWRM